MHSATRRNRKMERFVSKITDLMWNARAAHAYLRLEGSRLIWCVSMHRMFSASLAAVLREKRWILRR